MAAPSPLERYSAVAITLHWVIALVILAQIATGLWMTSAIHDAATQNQAFETFQLHKSLGLTVLALSLVRLAWRLTHRPPPLPANAKGWEKALAHLTHWAFYVLIIAMPLSGWLYVSTGWSHAFQRFFSAPTVVFGLFEAPHLPGVATLSEATRKSLGEATVESHEVLAYLTLALLVLHVGAVVKHLATDGAAVLHRMIPVFPPPDVGER